MNLRDTIGYPEVILAVIVIVTLVGVWLLFGYGLSDATSAENPTALSTPDKAPLSRRLEERRAWGMSKTD